MNIVAHRGIHHAHVENSLEAFLEAWSGGIAWCECDVHVTRDGVPVVMHDPTLERTSNGVEAIAERTLDELKPLRLKTAAGVVTESVLSTLEDVMTAMPRDCWMLVEIKPKQPEAGVQRIADVLKGTRVIVQSFDANMLHISRRFDREHEHVLLIGKDNPFDASPWDGINMYHEMATPQFVDSLRRQNKKWGAWTVNNPSDIERILRLEPDVIISDDPHAVSRARAGSSR